MLNQENHSSCFWRDFRNNGSGYGKIVIFLFQIIKNREKFLQKFVMEKLLEMKDTAYYYIATLLFFVWFVGFMGFNQGGAFHLIFLLAVVTVILKLIRDYSFKE